MDKGIAATATIIEAKPGSNSANQYPVVSTKAATAAMKPLASVPDADEPRIVSPSEYKAAALSLAEAFKDDHVAQYFVDVPDREQWSAEQKWDLHVSIMEYITYAHCLKGLVTAIGEDYGCVALWMPPGKNMDDIVTVLRSGMWRLKYKLSAEGRQRFFAEFLPLLHDTKASVLGARDDEAWYLVYIGTKASARGNGYARKLITHVTDMADAEARACYLESSNEVNLLIYGKMGFGLKRKIYLRRAEEDIELDIMVREPKGTSK